MTDKLFGRIVKVVIGTSAEQALVFDENFRIVFDVQSNNSSIANTAIIEIYNLSTATRAQIQNVINQNVEFLKSKSELLTLTLYGGYSEGGGYKIIFNGNITRVTTMLTVPDYITKIECGAGAIPLKYSILSHSFAAGIDSNTIIAQIAQALRLNISQASNYLQTKIYFAQGEAFTGLAKIFMDKITRAAGLTWFVDKGQIVIMDKTKALNEEAFLISAETGMIKSPEKLETMIGDTSEVVPTDGWKVTCLLIPEIMPTQKIKIKSKIVEGVYLVESVEHKGDNRGQAWNTIFQTRFTGL